MKTFVLLSTARSGTSAVGDVLAQSPDMCWSGELLNPDNYKFLRFAPRLIEEFRSVDNYASLRQLSDLADKDPSYLPEVAGRFISGTPATVFGLKILSGQAELSWIETLLRHEDVTAIVLWRNPLDTYISNVKAISKSVWNRLDQTDFKPELDVEHFANWYSDRQEFIHFICRNAKSIAGRVAYEDLFTEGRFNKRRLEEALSRVNLPLTDIGEEPALTIQDRNHRADDKVANLPAFRELLGAKSELLSASREVLQLSCLRDLATQ